MTEPVNRLVCMLVASLPIPSVPSFRDTCVVCDSEVWRSNRSVGMSAVPECVDCAMKDMDALRRKGEEVIVEPAPYIGRDIERSGN
jgi:hypothetical protein